MRVHAIGDIHGELDKLREAHARVADHAGEQALIVHVGDLIDRGPDSRGVVEYLREGQARGRNWVVLKGNHDRFLPRFLQAPDWVDPGLSTPLRWGEHEGLGAEATLRSYGLDPDQPLARLHAEALRKIPAEHAAWLDALPIWYLHTLALFVHAGIRPGRDLADQDEQDLLWIRREFLDDSGDHGILVVHGHTPVPVVEHHGNRLAIDTGAVFGGALSVVELSADGVSLLTEAGPVPIPPMPGSLGPRSGAGQ